MKSKTYPLVHITPAKICNPVYFPCQRVTSAPPMGLEMSAAIEMMAKIVPVLTPICLTSEICATMEGCEDDDRSIGG